MELGKLLKEERIKRGLSQQKLSYVSIVDLQVIQMALKKLEPKEPVQKAFGEVYNSDKIKIGDLVGMFCPTCGTRLNGKTNKCVCGQLLNWNCK